MLDKQSIELCKRDKKIKALKIKKIEFAIEQTEMIIKESKMSESELIFLRRKIADSRQDLEILYLI